MIDTKVLLTDLTRLLKRLEDDLRERALSPGSEVPELRGQLQAEWQAARDAERTAETFESWAEQVITQAGVHWLLSCVFLRFIEDNGLVDRPWISGTPQSGRLALARDGHDAYFRAHPHQNDRDFLIASFREAGALPGLHTFFDESHNPVFRLGISGDAAMAVMQFWQEVAADSGLLIRDFTDPAWNTRFLGDLYQDLSEATRKRYALLQTPEFVEEFILDRTLTPAIHEFGYREVRMIDPTCGSGHFLLGGFLRMVDQWSRNEPGRNRRDLTQRALDSIAGIDLNPFAVAISRFRMLVAALQASDVLRLVEAPDYQINVAIGDSLLHGKRFGLAATDDMFQGAEHFSETGLAHAYASEDLVDVQRILGRQYHAVVGNPPYIVVRDAALNAAYRQRYASCHMKYSLGAPFTERFFELAITGTRGRGAGFVGLITANSFMKREFGSRLIEQVLPRVDLTHVIDTAGAFIPGHGTPTVILLGQHRAPVVSTVRAVMGIKGEPSTPEVPASGLVWTALLRQIDQVGSQSEYASVSDIDRSVFGRHPWSIGGGGAAELREQLESGNSTPLSGAVSALGVMLVTLEDEVFLRDDPRAFDRIGAPTESLVKFSEGDSIRDWNIAPVSAAIYEYDRLGRHTPSPALDRYFWPFRALMRPAVYFGKTKEQRGMQWREYGVVVKDKLGSTPTIVLAEIATHNHFVLDRDGMFFKQTAPVIKLNADATEDDHLGLLGLLNSSTVCFWMKQVSHQKQMMGGDGIRVSEKSKVPYQFGSTQLKELPLPPKWKEHHLYPKLIELAREADKLARQTIHPSAAEIIDRGLAEGHSPQDLWTRVETARRIARSQLVMIQEEIDFVCYNMYSLETNEALLATFTDCPDDVDAGSRPFCIISQSNVDGYSVPRDLPDNWPAALRMLWARRIDAIKSNPLLKTIEDPHYKRRWIWRQGLFNHGAKANEFINGLHDWLVNRLESPQYWRSGVEQPPQLVSTARLADALRNDAHFMKVGALYTGRADFDPGQLIAELVAAEVVPFLPVQRYSDAGLRKRFQWQEIWAMERHEDRIDAEVKANTEDWRQELRKGALTKFGTDSSSAAIDWIEKALSEELVRHKVERVEAEVGSIPVPPKYQSKDFLKSDYWRLRGSLDIPKERWTSYPGCERGADDSLVISWAGWDHLQQATALATYFIDMKEREGWSPERLQPLLAGLLELVPWLKQWHNEMNPDFGARMGDYYESFVTEEARALQFTLEDLRAWKPPVTAAKRGRKKAA